MREYREWIAGVVVYFAAFAASYAASGSLPVALIVGLIFGVAAGLATYSLFPSDPELVEYQLDVRRRVKSVLKTTDEIRDLAKRVRDEPSRRSLLKASEVIRDLLSLAQAKDPGNMATTTAKVAVYISSVRAALDAQLQIEAHPDYWPDAAALLSANRDGFATFEEFALSNVQHLNQGEVASLRANLKMLTPMSNPVLTS